MLKVKKYIYAVELRAGKIQFSKIIVSVSSI